MTSRRNETLADKGFAGVVKGECEDFICVTAVKSLQFVKHSIHWTERLFWVVLIIGGMVLAIGDIDRVCHAYAHEYTYTRMSVRGLDELRFKDAIVCLDYDPLDLNLSDPQLLRHANMPEINDLAERANTSAVEFLNRSLRLSTAISLIENARTPDYEGKIAELLTVEYDLQSLQDWLKAQKVDLLKLVRTVGNWLCRASRLQIITLKGGALRSSANPCETKTITWLGVIPFVDKSTTETAVCVDVGSLIAFESMSRVVVTVNKRSLFLLESANRTADYGYSSYLEFSGDPVSSYMAKNVLQFQNGRCVSYAIDINAEMRLLDRKVARCNATAKSRFACFAECDARLFEMTDRCNCTLLAWHLLHNGQHRPMCFDVKTIEELLACRHETNQINFSERCFQSCLFPCTHRQYTATRIEACKAERYRGGASIELTPKGLTMPVFEEQFLLSLPEVFSRIGGTCGLWLGVGVFGICHVLLLPLKIAVGLFQHKINMKVGDTPTSSTVQLLAVEHLLQLD